MYLSFFGLKERPFDSTFEPRHFFISEKETAEYVYHRLRAAQAQIEIEFTAKAMRAIHDFSGGAPAKVNLVCDKCLFFAYSKVSYIIDEDIVEESIAEIDGGVKTDPQSTPSSSSRRYLKKTEILILIPFLFIVIAGGIYIGIRLALANMNASSAQIYDESMLEMANGSIETGGISALSVESASPAPPTNTPEKPEEPGNAPASVRKTHYLFNWQFDDDKVCRVNNPEFAYQAAIISWLRLWNIEVELDEFRSLDPVTAKKNDLTKRYGTGLKKYVIGEDFSRALRYNAPFILILENPPENLSPAVLLSRVEGMSLTIADPLWGTKTVGKSFLERYISQCLMLYFDSLGLDKIRVGEESERVIAIQTYLKKEGVLYGALSGAFDERTMRALRSLQEKNKINPSGRLDGETVLLLSLELMDSRPRLYSITGEK